MSSREKGIEEGEALLEIARELSNEQGLASVEEQLGEGDVRGARVYLLGVIDRKVADEKIDPTRATEIYGILGFDPEEASEIRQRNASLFNKLPESIN